MKEYSEIEAFCLSAKKTVEKFILTCAERKLTPSYDNFAHWMEAHPKLESVGNIKIAATIPGKRG